MEQINIGPSPLIGRPVIPGLWRGTKPVFPGGGPQNAHNAQGYEMLTAEHVNFAGQASVGPQTYGPSDAQKADLARHAQRRRGYVSPQAESLADMSWHKLPSGPPPRERAPSGPAARTKATASPLARPVISSAQPVACSSAADHESY